MNLPSISNITVEKIQVFVFLAFALISIAYADGVLSGSFSIPSYECGDDICGLNETCSSCEADCGSCSPDTGTDTSGNSGGYLINKSYYKLESVGSYEKWVVVGDELTFVVNNEEHKLKIMSITSEAIVINVSSRTVEVLIPLGETRFFDLDGDGWYDVSIYLNKINTGRANLGIELFAKKLVETAAPENAPATTPEPTPSASAVEPAATEAPVEQPIPLGMGIATVAVLIIAGIIVYVIVKRSGK